MGTVPNAIAFTVVTCVVHTYHKQYPMQQLFQTDYCIYSVYICISNNTHTHAFQYTLMPFNTHSCFSIHTHAFQYTLMPFKDESCNLPGGTAGYFRKTVSYFMCCSQHEVTLTMSFSSFCILEAAFFLTMTSTKESMSRGDR